jgi:TolA-binding protein
LFDAGRFAEAQAQFQKFLTDGAFGPLAATAQLGLAASIEAQGKADLAIAAYQKVVSSDSPNAATVQSAKAALARLQKPAAQPAIKS